MLDGCCEACLLESLGRKIESCTWATCQPLSLKNERKRKEKKKNNNNKKPHQAKTAGLVILGPISILFQKLIIGTCSNTSSFIPAAHAYTWVKTQRSRGIPLYNLALFPITFFFFPVKRPSLSWTTEKLCFAGRGTTTTTNKKTERK